MRLLTDCTRFDFLSTQSSSFTHMDRYFYLLGVTRDLDTNAVVENRNHNMDKTSIASSSDVKANYTKVSEPLFLENSMFKAIYTSSEG